MNCDELLLAGEIARFMRRLYRRGLTTTSGGNISARCGDAVLMTPGSTDKGCLKRGEVGALNLSDGRILTEGFHPTCEAGMHLEIYRTRPDVMAVVHAHPVTAGAFAAAEGEISTRLLMEARTVVRRIGRVPAIPFGTAELAFAAAREIGRCDALLLTNHGALTIGGSLLEAFDRLEVLENAAKTTLICEHLLKCRSLVLPENN